jgi:ATP-binding protein involved in chromosome partitioning
MSTEKPNLDPKLLEALSKVPYPGFDNDIVTMGLVEQAEMDGKTAKIKLKPLAAPPQVRDQLENEIANHVSQVAGVEELELDFPEPPKPKEQKGPKPIAGVKAVVPVASGKGGVGKSTVSVNLAIALNKLGLKVGLLDLDLYGPSIPLMMGAEGVMPNNDGDKVVPVNAHGIKLMSIGFLMEKGRALIWRGPLIMKAVEQLMKDVAWGELDVLILDLPPGTGDVQITMAQTVPLTGAVVVTTPQDVALIDAVKGVDMFKSVEADVLGIIENMSYFICDGCNKRHEIFGHGSVKPLCENLGVDFLGELPLDTSVRSSMDMGHPAALADSPAAEAYLAIAEKVKAKLVK